MTTLLISIGSDIPDVLYAQIDEAERREFGLPLPPKANLNDRMYFLLVDESTDRLLACGFLRPIEPVLFGDESFSFLNIGGVIANEKGQGFGRLVMTAMRDYLMARDQTGLGFCFPHNAVFYEKCGFQVDAQLTPRFIYREGEQRYTAEGQCVLFLESSNRFMERVRAQPDVEVYVPDPWSW